MMLNKKMDLPNMIVDAATVKYVEKQKENTCTFVINYHQKYEYKINFVATKNDIIVTYKTLKLRIPKSEKNAMKDVVSFFSYEIEQDMTSCVREDIEFGGYWPDNEEYFDVNTLRVVCKEKQVFFKHFKDISDTLPRMMDIMVFLN